LVIAVEEVVLGLDVKGEFIGAIVPAVPALLKDDAIIGTPISLLPRAIELVKIWLKLAPAPMFRV
jgi:hypothetical protein